MGNSVSASDDKKGVYPSALGTADQTLVRLRANLTHAETGKSLLLFPPGLDQAVGKLGIVVGGPSQTTLDGAKKRAAARNTDDLAVKDTTQPGKNDTGGETDTKEPVPIVAASGILFDLPNLSLAGDFDDTWFDVVSKDDVPVSEIAYAERLLQIAAAWTTVLTSEPKVGKIVSQAMKTTPDKNTPLGPIGTTAVRVRDVTVRSLKKVESYIDWNDAMDATIGETGLIVGANCQNVRKRDAKASEKQKSQEEPEKIWVYCVLFSSGKAWGYTADWLEVIPTTAATTPAIQELQTKYVAHETVARWRACQTDELGNKANQEDDGQKEDDVGTDSDGDEDEKKSTDHTPSSVDSALLRRLMQRGRHFG